MNQHTINNNNYFIFDKDISEQKLHFLWGKFDFRIKFRLATQGEYAQYEDASGNLFIIDFLEGFLKKQWHRYEKVTGHGFTFEETCWSLDGNLFYVELPKNLRQAAMQLAALEFHWQPATPQTAKAS